MKKQLPAWVMLGLVTMVSGLLLGFANSQTAAKIAEQTEIAANEARQKVLPGADEFTKQDLEEGSPLLSIYEAKSGGNVVGYVTQMAAKGYGGEIEVMTGVNTEGVIMGIDVGGAKFSETAGLGAKAKDAAFTDQFRDKEAPVSKDSGVNAISGATITSGAVMGAVNTSAEYVKTLLGLGAAKIELLPGNPPLTEGTADGTVDAVWTAENGMIVQASGEGYNNLVSVKVGILKDGTINAIEVVKEGFEETPGYGMRVFDEPEFLAQFNGKSGALAYGEGIDALSGASFTSDAIMEGVNKALAFAAANG